LAGRYRQIKSLVSFQEKVLNRWIAIKRFQSQSRREGVFDPIPPLAGLDQKKISLCDLRVSAVSLIKRGKD